MYGNNGKNILICGLAGQGVGLLGNIIGDFYLKQGYEIKVSDVMGLGQRGGNVECHFRCSQNPIMSPLIKFGDADYIVSLELTETVRNLHYLKNDGAVISSTFEMSTPTVNIGLQSDIQNKEYQIKNRVQNSYFIDIQKYQSATDYSHQMMNIVMLAFFMNYMRYEYEKSDSYLSKCTNQRYDVTQGIISPDKRTTCNEDLIIESIRNNLKPSLIENNVKAYELGEEIFKDSIMKTTFIKSFDYQKGLSQFKRKTESELK